MKNWMGEELGAGQRRIVEAYRLLEETVRQHEERLAPFEERNALKALACLWQIVNGLDMDPEQLYDLGA